MAAGFNGARLHQKVFEERYLYHADRLGYLLWGEFADWGANQDDRVGRQEPTISFVTQWLETLERDYSHPSIVGWCPLNETYQPLATRLSDLDDTAPPGAAAQARPGQSSGLIASVVARLNRPCLVELARVVITIGAQLSQTVLVIREQRANRPLLARHPRGYNGLGGSLLGRGLKVRRSCSDERCGHIA